MKKLNKLQINSEKTMMNEELLTLRGGYGSPCTCKCYDIYTKEPDGYYLSETGYCLYSCQEAFGPTSTGSCGD